MFSPKVGEEDNTIYYSVGYFRLCNRGKGTVGQEEINCVLFADHVMIYKKKKSQEFDKNS